MDRNVYSAQGYAGQTLFVFPDKDLIVVTTASLDYRRYQDLYNMILKEIPGAIRSTKAASPKTPRPQARSRGIPRALPPQNPRNESFRFPRPFRLAKGKKGSVRAERSRGQIIYPHRYRD